MEMLFFGLKEDTLNLLKQGSVEIIDQAVHNVQQVELPFLFWASFCVTCFLLLPPNLLVFLLTCFAALQSTLIELVFHCTKGIGSNPEGEKKAHKYTCIARGALWTGKQRMSCVNWIFLLTIFVSLISVFSLIWWFITKNSPQVHPNRPDLPHQSTTWPFGLLRGNLDQDHLLPSKDREKSSQLDTQAGKQTKAQLDRPLRALPTKQQLLASVGGFPSVRQSVPLTGVFSTADLWVLSWPVSCREERGLPSKCATPFQPKWLMVRIIIHF